MLAVAILRGLRSHCSHVVLIKVVKFARLYVNMVFPGFFHYRLRIVSVVCIVRFGLSSES